MSSLKTEGFYVWRVLCWKCCIVEGDRNVGTVGGDLNLKWHMRGVKSSLFECRVKILFFFFNTFMWLFWLWTPHTVEPFKNKSTTMTCHLVYYVGHVSVKSWLQALVTYSPSLCKCNSIEQDPQQSHVIIISQAVVWTQGGKLIVCRSHRSL